jgi:hypothetical protein
LGSQEAGQEARDAADCTALPAALLDLRAFLEGLGGGSCCLFVGSFEILLNFRAGAMWCAGFARQLLVTTIIKHLFKSIIKLH